MVRDLRGKQRVRVLYLGEAEPARSWHWEASSSLLKGSDHRGCGFGRNVAKHHESPLGEVPKTGCLMRPGGHPTPEATSHFPGSAGGTSTFP